MISDPRNELMTMRKIYLDYLRAYHSLTWELEEKHRLVTWRICGEIDVWALNTALLSYMDTSIRSISLLEKIDLIVSKDRCLAHSFLREWRNLSHHDQIILFEPTEVDISHYENSNREILSLPATFYTYPVINKMIRVTEKNSGLQRFISEFGRKANDDTFHQVSTLMGAIKEHHIFMMNTLSAADKERVSRLPAGGINVGAYPFPRTRMSPKSAVVPADDIWKA